MTIYIHIVKNTDIYILKLYTIESTKNNNAEYEKFLKYISLLSLVE